MLNEKQQTVLKKELVEMKEHLSTTADETDSKESAQEAAGELSMYDNHPADMGTELFEREKDIALNIHANSELEKVENALQAMQDGTYGICEVCQKKFHSNDSKPSHTQHFALTMRQNRKYRMIVQSRMISSSWLTQIHMPIEKLE